MVLLFKSSIFYKVPLLNRREVYFGTCNLIKTLRQSKGESPNFFWYQYLFRVFSYINLAYRTLCGPVTRLQIEVGFEAKKSSDLYLLEVARGRRPIVVLSPISERVLLEVAGNWGQWNFILFCLQKRGRKIEWSLLEVGRGRFENSQRVQIEGRLLSV